MGLLKHVLFWPVTGPLFLTEFALRRVEGAVRDELTDDDAVREELLELQIRLELGEIDDEDYVRREAALMRRLREVREWKEAFGMPTAGGPVRAAAGPPHDAGDDREPEPGDGAEWRPGSSGGSMPPASS